MLGIRFSYKRALQTEKFIYLFSFYALVAIEGIEFKLKLFLLLQSFSFEYICKNVTFAFVFLLVLFSPTWKNIELKENWIIKVH